MEEWENIRKLYGYLPQVLTDREEHVIAMRYGVLGEEPHTQREVAATLGISRSYVSRIEKRHWQSCADSLKKTIDKKLVLCSNRLEQGKNKSFQKEKV